MATIPTKRVRRRDDDIECVINASDFDSDLHEDLDPPTRERLAESTTITEPTDEPPTGDAAGRNEPGEEEPEGVGDPSLSR